MNYIAYICCVNLKDIYNMSNKYKEEIYKQFENMVAEYSILSYDEKVKYMNNLTEWYMREKDTLNNILYKIKD